MHAVSRHPLVLAACVSMVAHGMAASALRWSGAEAEEEDAPDIVVDVDLEIAPEAPGGFDPIEEAPQPAEPPEPEPADEDQPDDETTLEPEPEPKAEEKPAVPPEPDPDDEAEARADPSDAGPADAGTAIAADLGDAGPGDGGPPQTQVAAAAGDAGPTTAGPTTTRPEATSDRALGRLPKRVPPGAAVDLRPYAPPKDKVVVLLRYDRLRRTPWAAMTDAILAPMPDYRAIVGDRNVPLTRLFQVLLISSRNPTDVTATNLVARTSLGPAEVRRFLNHKLQPIAWRVVRGGVAGRRQHSEVVSERDGRVYLLPMPGWVVLTKAKHLGVLLDGAAGASGAQGAATLDTARAAEADLPPWLARARSVENEAGVDSGPVAVVTVGGLRRTAVEVPEVGVVPVPERFSLALEMSGKEGFYVRGTLHFTTVERAQEFYDRLTAGRSRLLEGRFGQLLLKNFHAFHAVKGLALRQRGLQVTYATSISNADAKAAMTLAAEWARRFYETQKDAAATEPSVPAPPVPPARPQASPDDAPP